MLQTPGGWKSHCVKDERLGLAVALLGGPCWETAWARGARIYTVEVKAQKKLGGSRVDGGRYLERWDPRPGKRMRKPQVDFLPLSLRPSLQGSVMNLSGKLPRWIPKKTIQMGFFPNQSRWQPVSGGGNLTVPPNSSL